ncbi:MAG TPA: response regulator, partial [Labilithrix sp.]|nr:response regulator [Labilithrix sp.]
GLDVVKKKIESMLGSIDLSFRVGEGTRFSLVVPLTLTTIRGLLVRAGGQTFVIPGTAVKELLRTPLDAARSLGGVETLAVRDQALPLVSLAGAVGRPGAPALTAGKASVVVVRLEGSDVAVVVDELIDEREVVVKSLGPRLRNAKHVSGATVLPSGRLALILNMGDVISRARTRAAPTSLRAAGRAEGGARKRKVLLVDDSVTTRALERSILEAGGFAVVVAFDGVEGWRILQEEPIDVVVSDVEMPRMDGFTLTETIRSHPRFRDLPVVLVTGRSSDADRARGLDVGANAYLVKSDFDQQHLLETLSQLL